MGDKTKKAAKLLRDFWLMLGITVLVLLGIEFVCRGVLWLKERSAARSFSKRQILMEQKVEADAFENADWAKDYLDELFRCSVVRWHSYSYWRKKPFHGRYIKVNSTGIRQSWQAPQSKKPLKIFLFGGSTMWGVGARDDYTIPSLLAKELNRKDIPAQITNFGETGYVSTQSVICLLQQLQQNNVPDLVIFYDGVNDTHSAWQQGKAGLPPNEFNREREFNLSLSTRGGELRNMALRDVARNTGVVRLLRSRKAKNNEVAGSGLQDDGETNEKIAAPKMPNRDKIIDDTISIYINNLRAVQALGVGQNFGCLFYWQPTLFEKQNLTSYERRESDARTAFRPFITDTYAIVGHHQTLQNEPTFHDISLLFSNKKEPLYIDWCHLAEPGNQIVAERMAQDVAMWAKKANVKAKKP